MTIEQGMYNNQFADNVTEKHDQNKNSNHGVFPRHFSLIAPNMVSIALCRCTRKTGKLQLLPVDIRKMLDIFHENSYQLIVEIF